MQLSFPKTLNMMFVSDLEMYGQKNYKIEH